DRAAWEKLVTVAVWRQGRSAKRSMAARPVGGTGSGSAACGDGAAAARIIPANARVVKCLRIVRLPAGALCVRRVGRPTGNIGARRRGGTGVPGRGRQLTADDAHGAKGGPTGGGLRHAAAAAHLRRTQGAPPGGR